MTNQKTQEISFFIILAFMAVVAIVIIWPFLRFVAMAIILSVLFYPLYERIAKKIKRNGWAAFFTVMIILLIVALPLWFVGQAIVNELVVLYRSGNLQSIASGKIPQLQNAPLFVQRGVEALAQGVSEFIGKFSANALGTISYAISNIGWFVLSLFLILFTIYYLLKDSKNIRDFFKGLSPLSTTHGDILFNRLNTSINGVVRGSFLTSVIQGAVATIGFFIFGVPQPFLWGLFTMLAAFVPTFGTSISLIPAILLLFFTGHSGEGVGLSIWAATAVGLVDNFISPRIIGAQAKLHPLLTLLSILGGVQLFGFLGFLFGPILMSIFITLLDIYRQELC